MNTEGNSSESQPQAETDPIMARPVDYYAFFGVPKNASENEVKSAYRKLALEWHPDRKPGDKFAEEKFKLINEVNETLSDSVKRLQYDRRSEIPNASYEGAKPEYAPWFSGQERSSEKKSPKESSNKENALTKVWLIIDTARIILEKGELVPNIDHIRLILRTLERHKSSEDYMHGSWKDKKTTDSLLGELREVIFLHESLEMKKAKKSIDDTFDEPVVFNPWEQGNLGGLYGKKEPKTGK